MSTMIIHLTQYTDCSVSALASVLINSRTCSLPTNKRVIKCIEHPTQGNVLVVVWEFFAQHFGQKNIWSQAILISTDFHHTRLACLPLVSYTHPKMHQSYITIFTALVTPHKLCAHISTTSHHSGMLTVLWELALPWDTTHLSNK
jgi:hypothetical protein